MKTKTLTLIAACAALLMAGCASTQTQPVIERVEQVNEQGEVMGSYQVVNGIQIDNDTPGAIMAQSAISEIATPKAWYEGLFSFLEPSDRKYAHVELNNATMVQAYFKFLEIWERNPMKLAGPNGSMHEIPLPAPNFSEFAAYFKTATSIAEEMGVDVWSLLAIYATKRTFDMNEKAMGISEGAQNAGIQGARAGSAASVEGVNTGVNATVTGAGILAE